MEDACIVGKICGTRREKRWPIPSSTRRHSNLSGAGRPLLALLNGRRSVCSRVPLSIGGALNSGQPHDFRSPDYDDWSLSGDLLFWDEGRPWTLRLRLGIRGDAEALKSQLAIAERTAFELAVPQMHSTASCLPLAALAKSRLCMLLLKSTSERCRIIYLGQLGAMCRGNFLSIA